MRIIEYLKKKYLKFWWTVHATPGWIQYQIYTGNMSIKDMEKLLNDMED